MNKVFLLLVATAFFAVIFTEAECGCDDPPVNDNANNNKNDAAANAANENNIKGEFDAGLLGR